MRATAILAAGLLVSAWTAAEAAISTYQVESLRLAGIEVDRVEVLSDMIIVHKGEGPSLLGNIDSFRDGLKALRLLGDDERERYRAPVLAALAEVEIDNQGQRAVFALEEITPVWSGAPSAGGDAPEEKSSLDRILDIIAAHGNQKPVEPPVWDGEREYILDTGRARGQVFSCTMGNTNVNSCRFRWNKEGMSCTISKRLEQGTSIAAAYTGNGELGYDQIDAAELPKDFRPIYSLDMGRALDHIGAYNFKVEIDGVTTGDFRPVDGLEAEVEVIEYQDGDDLFLRKRPGRSKFNDIVLKKGYLATQDLQDWWKNCRDGKYDRRDISIILNDNAANEVVSRWSFGECFPIQWKINGFDGKSNDVVIEEITFVVEDMQIQ